MNEIVRDTTTFDIEAIRADFPILSRQVHGRPLVYLDNGASAQKPQEVLDTIQRAYAEEYANVHRGLHTLSNLATERFEAARETVRRFLNAPSKDDIIFTRNATEAINLVASSFGHAFIEQGDEIIVSLLEHHSNIVPWHFHRERTGAVLKWIPVDDDGQLIVEEYEKLFTARTKIVAVTQMSNALGTITPLEQIIRIAHEHGVPVLVDGAQGAVHMPVDVQAMDADFYVFTGHKTYGPSGIGALYGKREWLEKLPPYMGGGEMVGEVTTDRIDYAAPPHRFEAGTPPIVQAIGLAAALDYMEGVGREAIAAHEARLLAYAHERLSEIDGLRIIGTAREKGAIVSFEIAGVHAHDLSQLIDRYGVAVRAGTHCAQPILQRFGVKSTCRASFALYNTESEIDALAEAIEKAKTFFM
ncbi:MAG TPA: cysteine desulfurase [Thermopetrobacter sp.]|nr:cysteine desulfurase [Thermopetrobacter sp.]